MAGFRDSPPRAWLPLALLDLFVHFFVSAATACVDLNAKLLHNTQGMAVCACVWGRGDGESIEGLHWATIIDL